MKLWTYAEASQKVLVEMDLQDQTFITPSELIGLFNDGIEEAESEIHKIDEDYFLAAHQPMAVQAGTSAYAYPSDIYAMKVRGLMYINGANVYQIHKVKRKDKFDRIANTLQFGSSDDYQWYPSNDSTNGARLNFVPAMRDTGTVSPTPSASTPIYISYIRKAKRVPLLGEYIPVYEQIWQATAVDPTGDTLATSGTYVTGDQVKLSTTGTIPTGLAASTLYYVSRVSATQIKLATSLANAQAGTAIDITGAGSGILTISIAANQTIINNTVLDIPEFTKFVIQWVKAQCLAKEGDPRYDGAKEMVEQQRAQMVSTLTDAQPDDENQLTPDMSAYSEMS